VAAASQHIKTMPMSATAATDPLGLYSLGLALGLHRGVDFLGWCMQYGVRRGRFAFEFMGGTEDLARLHKTLFPEHGYRATYSDIPGFPANTVEAIGVPVSHPEQIDELYARVEELEQMKTDALEPVVIRLRARQMSELMKAPAMVEMAKDAIAEGQSVVIFVNFIDSLELIASKFKKIGVIRGGQSEGVRESVIQGFQTDRTHVVVCQIQAGGVGISLHDVLGNRPRKSLISPPDGARALIQALGRIHRAGAKSPAIQNIIFAEGTVETRALRATQRKVKQIDTLHDGDLDPTST